ncbi:MAG: PA2169 family four-helix-bundle protein [Deltaproteobacteria bacterium]
MNNDEVISTLNELIETCKDGENGYQTAAENIENGEYKQLFNQYSQQRAKFANELKAEVSRLGGDPEDSGSVAGSLHRGWMNIKSAVSSNDLSAIISECEEGEDVALKNYDEALEKGLPADVRSVVNTQYIEVKKAHDHIRSLEKKLD